MIRVIIVEDEPPIMRVIAKFIEAFSQTFKIVGTAINGKKALELLETEEVDVVFTDIKMPIMDGLELAQRIRETRPDLMIIIISGFQDFEYARKALRFQVYDYLLKPLTPDAVNNLLGKIEQEIMIRDKQRQRQKIMTLINEKHACPEERSDEAGYGVFLICVGAFPLIPNDSMLPAKSIWEQVNLEKEVSAILHSEESCMCFNGKTTAEMVVVFQVQDKKRIQEVVKDFTYAFQKNSYLPLTLVSTENITELNQIGKVLEQLREKLYTHIKLFTSQVLWLHTKEELDNSLLDLRLIADTLGSSAKLGEEQLKNAFETILEQFLEAKMTQMQATTFFYDTISNIFYREEQLKKESLSLKIDIDTAVSNAVDIKSLAKDIAFILLGESEDEKRLGERKNISDIAQKIEEYLQLNYQKSITTNMLSKKFGFVPSYISKLFRAYKGMSPSEYLTYYRIEKSKQIMLNEPEILCKEVALRVGFNDQYHFSKTFKKQTGIWPTEYVIKK